MTTKKKKLVEELVQADFVRLDDLAKEMETMAKTVDKFPEALEYTPDNIETLEEARHQALKLAHDCEMAIKCFEGRVGE